MDKWLRFLQGAVTGAALALAVAAPVAASDDRPDTLLWSQRYDSEYAAPEMFAAPALVDVWAAIYDAFEREGWPLTYAQAVRLAVCESGLNPRAFNPASGAAGVYQFTPPTWAWASEAAGFAGRSRYDLEANAGTAAWLMARPEYGGSRHWAACAWSF